MAMFNEILVGRYNRALQKLFGLKGGPPAPQLASEISPSLAVSDFFSDVYYPNGFELFAKNATQGAVAAQNTAVRWRNPKASNVIALILLITAESGTATEILGLEWQPTGAVDLGTILPTTIQNIDNRTRQSCTLIVSGGNNIAASQFTVQQRGAPTANQAVDFINHEVQLLPLLPDSSFTIRTTNVNTALSASVLWRERALEEGERT